MTEDDFAQWAKGQLVTIESQQAEIERLRALLVRAKGAVNDSYALGHAEWQGHDNRASKLDDRIWKWRNDVDAALKEGDDG